VPLRWARDGGGVGVRGVRTRWGALSYLLGPAGAGYRVRLEPGLRVPPGGVRIAPPGVTAGWSADVNGVPAAVSAAGEVVVRAVPATVELQPPR
jgi:hypothetical protein